MGSLRYFVLVYILYNFITAFCVWEVACKVDSKKEREKSDILAKAIYGALRDSRNVTREKIKLGWKPIRSTNNIEDETKRLVCYYDIPTLEDHPYSVFPEVLDPSLCTHIILRHAEVKGDSFELVSERSEEFVNRTLVLRKKNPLLKILVGLYITKFDEGFENFQRKISDAQERKLFVIACLKKVKQLDFDGLDIDWNYPAFYGPFEQKQQFSALLQDFRWMIAKQKSTTLITSAVPALQYLIDLGFDIPKLSESLDFINLKTFDFHTFSWLWPFTGPNSPLFGSNSETGYFSTLNVAWSANYWYQNGMLATKINVGIPTYGRSYELTDENNHGYHAVAEKIGSTGKNGIAAYPEVCKIVESKDSISVFDNFGKVPYVVKHKEWISFDNEESSKFKASWVNQVKFGGVNLWKLNYDDAYKTCSTTRSTFPITRTVASILRQSF